MALLLAYTTLCLPVCNSFAPLGFGIWAVVNGFRGIRMSRSLQGRESEMGVTPTATKLHMAIGIACIPLGLLPVGLNLIGLVFWLFVS